MENRFAERIAAIRALMRENGWDILILTGSDPHASEYPAERWKQVPWASGFTGEAGDLVVTADHAGLWTDTRYFIQARRQLEGTGIELHKLRVPDAVSIEEWIAALEWDRPVIAVDGLCFTAAAVRALQEAVPGARIETVPDVLSPLWEDRPAVPVTPIITLGEDLAGESREGRLHRLRRWMVLHQLDAVFVSALDEIAWLLNVRGSDIEYNPFVISYLLVTLDDARWFVRRSEDVDAETEESLVELEADGVMIRGYDEAAFALATLRQGGVDRLALDPAQINTYLRESIDDGDAPGQVVEMTLPIALWKAVKIAS